MDKREMMENLVHEAYKKGVFNGTWLYAENGNIVSKGAVGFRDYCDQLPMREDSVFELASISKQFTAAAVMRLVRDGLLHLDDEITGIFPQIPYPGVTIRHLLTHTGGVRETYDDNLCLKAGSIRLGRMSLARRMIRDILASGTTASYMTRLSAIRPDLLTKMREETNNVIDKSVG